MASPKKVKAKGQEKKEETKRDKNIEVSLRLSWVLVRRENDELSPLKTRNKFIDPGILSRFFRSFG